MYYIFVHIMFRIIHMISLRRGGTFVVDSRYATYASRKLAGNLYLHTMAHLLKTTKELLTLFNFDNNITVGFFIVQ